MVVFTCGQCNESLKKNQVEKHYQSRCRNCNMLSCVDCGKDFYGDSYKEHIKCISEEEKYSGKNYKPKPNANKGEVKQEQWLQKVQKAIDKSVTNHKLKTVLERMKDYPNIPRKKAKFENFVINSMNVRDKKLVADVWEVLLAHTDEPVSDDTTAINENSVENGHKTVVNSDVKIPSKIELKEISKQERKAERKRLKNKERGENREIEMDKQNDSVIENSEKSQKKKSKKRKRQNTETEGDETETKKLYLDDTPDDKSLNVTSEETEGDSEETGKSRKFDWEGTITAVLSSKGEVSLKKLKKKVLAQYLAEGGKLKSEDKILAKLNKKINKNPNFIVKKEKVKLKSSK